jgi:hypothetical protein
MTPAIQSQAAVKYLKLMALQKAECSSVILVLGLPFEN